MKDKILYIIGLVAALVAAVSGIWLLIIKQEKTVSIKVDLTNQEYVVEDTKESIKKYTKEEYEQFYKEYTNNELPGIYITEFLFDGAGMYKAYDLDDFVENGNDYELDVFDITVLNINTLGDIELSGKLKGMVAVNTNNLKGNINIILNNVNINSNTKKAPAIYVYNKDITYTDAIVTIKTLENTNNYIEGGKLKKVSLIPSDDYTTYANKYKYDVQSTYTSYTNYYGIYTSSQINNILFAKVTADNEDLQDADPYYYYKASGAISSDIDINFEGEGYLSVKSKNKEGIESKGNISFSGGTGDYYVTSYDDCINTTTDKSENSNARNTLTINVKSLYAIVDNEADEGDAIDSNGELIINGGLVVAISKPGADSGLDSNSGTYINGGTVLATGDMYDQINESSKQSFIVLSFSDKPVKDDLITLLDSNDSVVFAYKTDRTFTNLIYSSSSLKEGSYYLYKNGTIFGDNNNGLYTNIESYDLGTLLGYNTKSYMTGPNGNQGRPNPNMGNQGPMGNPPEMNNPNMGNQTNMNNTSLTATNKEFIIDGISNMFIGISEYKEEA